MNRIIVITGGTSGIGLMALKMFEQAGDTVIALANIEGDVTNYMYCDVSNADNIKECFDKIKQQYNKIDVLINCAGYGLNGALELIEMDKIKHQFEVNVFGLIECTNQALPLMSKGGKVINVSSAMALFPLPYRSMYAASKSAVLALSISQRMELSNYGIEVSALCPGNAKTNFTKNKTVVIKTNERYGDAIQKAQDKLDNAKSEQKRMDPKICARDLFKMANRKSNKPFIISGNQYKFLYFIKRLVPTRLMIWAINKFAN